ncbi:MAG: hypothetical protein KF747_04620, partial [Nitrospira sp.]|nr:hypothetical protein [Nitrospira sp.]
MPIKQIREFKLFCALPTDTCRIDFLFTDGTTDSTGNISPSHYTALVATLQASRLVYYCFDAAT